MSFPAYKYTPTTPYTTYSHPSSTIALPMNGMLSSIVATCTRIPGNTEMVRSGFSARNVRIPLTFPPPDAPIMNITSVIVPETTMTKSKRNHGLWRYAPGPMKKFRATICTKNSPRKNALKKCSAYASDAFHDESSGAVGSYIASKTQLTAIAAMTTLSKYGCRMIRQARLRTRERSWNKYSDVLFSFSSRHRVATRSFVLTHHDLSSRLRRFRFFFGRCFGSVTNWSRMTVRGACPGFAATTGIAASDDDDERRRAHVSSVRGRGSRARCGVSVRVRGLSRARAGSIAHRVARARLRVVESARRAAPTPLRGRARRRRM